MAKRVTLVAYVALFQVNEVKTMALNLITGSNRSIYTSMLAVFLTAGLSACQQAPQEHATLGKITDQVIDGIFYSPYGAVMPAGLDEITSGATQDEVIKILGPRYQRIQNPRLDHFVPIKDAFFYKEDGETKYIDVWYVNSGVDYVRFGYDSLEGLQ